MGVSYLIDSFLEEIQPVVTENFEPDKGAESILFEFSEMFGLP